MTRFRHAASRTLLALALALGLGLLAPGLALAIDLDADGRDDARDNCPAVANAAQRDADLDGIGDACDCDFNQTGSCNILDFNIIRTDLRTGHDSGVGTDMNGDGLVSILDFNLFRVASADQVPGPGLSGDLPHLELPGVTCEGDGANAWCTIEPAPGIAFQTPRANLEVRADGGFTLEGTSKVPTAAGDLTLFEGTLVFEPGDAFGTGIGRLRGTVRLPFPRVGFLKDAEVEREPMADLGLDLGVNLASLDAPLVDDRKYLFFDFAAGYEASIQPITFSTPGGTLTMVVDPSDPFFFISGSVEGLKRGKDGSGDSGSSSTGGDGGSTSGGDGSSSGSGGSSSGGSSSDGTGSDGSGSADGSGSKDDDIEGGAAFGISNLGLIHYEPINTWGFEDEIGAFDGHMIERMTLPISGTPLEISGEIVTDLDPDEDGDNPFDPFGGYLASPDIRYGGNGSLEVGVDFLTFFSWGFGVGQASVGVYSGDAGQEVFASGSASVGLADMLPAALPIPMNPQRSVDVAAYFSSENDDDFITMESEFTIDASVFTVWTGVEMGEIYSQASTVRIDKTGLRLTGRTGTEVVPGVGFDGEIVTEAFISADGLSSFIRLNGNMVVGGIPLADAELVIAPTGIVVTGIFEGVSSSIMMTGRIDANGPSLGGATSVSIDVESVTEVLQTVTDGATCGYQVVTDAAVCGYDTVTSGALCGFETVTSSLICGTKTVTSGAICGYETITSAAACGTKTICGYLPYPFDKLCKEVAKSCSVAKSCTVARTCEDPNQPKSCDVPGTCEDLSQPLTCERSVELTVYEGTFEGDAELELDIHGLDGTVTGSFEGEPIADGGIVDGDACVDVLGFGTFCSPL